MRASSHPLVVAAILLLAAATLPACSEPTPAAKAPRRSATSTTTSSPTPTKLTPEQEVEAAVRAYYAELTRAAQTNDTSKLKTLIHKNCPCAGSARSIDETAKRGLMTRSAAWTVRSIDVHDVTAGAAAAEVRYDVSAFSVHEEDGTVVDRYPKRSAHVDLSLVLLDGRWVLANVFDLEPR